MPAAGSFSSNSRPPPWRSASRSSSTCAKVRFSWRRSMKRTSASRVRASPFRASCTDWSVPRVRWRLFTRTSSTKLRSSSAVRRDQGRLRSIRMRSASFQRGISADTSTSRSWATSCPCSRATLRASVARMKVRLASREAWKYFQPAKEVVPRSSRAPSPTAPQPRASWFCRQRLGSGARLSFRTGIAIRGPRTRGFRAAAGGGEECPRARWARPRSTIPAASGSPGPGRRWRASPAR